MTKAITLKSPTVNVKKQQRAIDKALNESAQFAKKAYGRVTKTWQHKPQIAIRRKGYTRDIGTDDEIYDYVDGGTKPHDIFPKRKKRLAFSPGGAPKTSPGVVGSGSGAKGSGVVFMKAVHHPGSAPRDFETPLIEEVGPEFERIMEREINAAAD